MKILILCLLFSVSCLGQDSTNKAQDIAQVSTRKDVDQNTKSITQLTIAVSGLCAFIGVLLLYIKKSHSKTIVIVEKVVGAITESNASNEKLATAIEVMGDKISGAVDRNSVIVNDAHMFIIKNLK